jgi:hypothetical protein
MLLELLIDLADFALYVLYGRRFSSGSEYKQRAETIKQGSKNGGAM